MANFDLMELMTRPVTLLDNVTDLYGAMRRNTETTNETTRLLKPANTEWRSFVSDGTF